MTRTTQIARAIPVCGFMSVLVLMLPSVQFATLAHQVHIHTVSPLKTQMRDFGSDEVSTPVGPLARHALIVCDVRNARHVRSERLAHVLGEPFPCVPLPGDRSEVVRPVRKVRFGHLCHDSGKAVRVCTDTDQIARHVDNALGCPI